MLYLLPLRRHLDQVAKKLRCSLYAHQRYAFINFCASGLGEEVSAQPAIPATVLGGSAYRTGIN
jgi:hypothetical protein